MRNSFDTGNVDLIETKWVFKCESVKGLSEGTVRHSRWQSTYAVGDEFF